LSDYYADKRTKDGKCAKCKKCWEIVYKSWKSRNRETWIQYNWKWYENSGARFKRRGITEEEYNEILKSQDGVCAICKREERVVVRGKIRPLHIDHDHITKKFRGLLCSAYNTAIGKFEDNIEYLLSAIKYLEKEKP